MYYLDIERKEKRKKPSSTKTKLHFYIFEVVKFDILRSFVVLIIVKKFLNEHRIILFQIIHYRFSCLQKCLYYVIYDCSIYFERHCVCQYATNNARGFVCNSRKVR